MTEEQFSKILSKQMSITEKRMRSDYVIKTDTIEHAREQVQQILQQIRSQMNYA